ncbi:MAG: ThuA domain-containing protein [Amnibacterium sp.]
MRCVLVSAAGDYADPWHPFEATSAALAGCLTPLLGDVEVRTDVEAALAAPADLLVLNLGDAGPGEPGPQAQAGLLAHAAAGRPILAVHSTATTYPGWPAWAELLGGRWIRGRTFHPPHGPAGVRVAAGHPVTAALTDFDTLDERYTDLQVDPASTVIAWHEQDGRRHPLAWVRSGPLALAGYVALCHDSAAYGEGTRRLVERTAGWLIEERDRP